MFREEAPPWCTCFRRHLRRDHQAMFARPLLRGEPGDRCRRSVKPAGVAGAVLGEDERRWGVLALTLVADFSDGAIDHLVGGGLAGSRRRLERSPCRRAETNDAMFAARGPGKAYLQVCGGPSRSEGGRARGRRGQSRSGTACEVVIPTRTSTCGDSRQDAVAGDEARR